MDNLVFNIDKNNLRKIFLWQKEIDLKNIQKQKEIMSPQDFSLLTDNGKYPYTGAIGGSLTYHFTVGLNGIRIVVEDGLSKEKLILKGS